MRLIDADELLIKFKETREVIDFVAEDKNVNKDYIRGQIMRLENCILEVNTMPTVDTEKHGYWIKKIYDIELTFDHITKYKCSNCKTHWDIKTNYCSYCGAKMDKLERKENKI